jgi:hypothetical protein
MNICSFVAPAIKAPSGVKESATTADPIVIEHLDLDSDERAFQMLMAPSSPEDASNRSESSPSPDGNCIGCQANEVISP